MVTNGEPRPIAELMAACARPRACPRPTRHVPVALALAAGGAPSRRRGRWADRLSPAGPSDDDPPMTRFVVEQLSTAHWFDQRRTRELLRWQPRIPASTRVWPSSSVGMRYGLINLLEIAERLGQ